MALGSKNQEKFYATSGGGADQATSDDLTTAAALWNLDKAEGNKYLLQHPDFGPIIYQLQQMQDDIEELRRYIVSAELLQPDTMGDNLPTSDPRTSGQLWSNRGTVTLSS